MPIVPTRYWLPLSLLLCLPARAQDAPQPFCQPWPDQKNGELCVLSHEIITKDAEGEESPEMITGWFSRLPNGEKKVHPSPEVSLMQVIEFRIAPDGKHVAVLSVGEGHPMIDVFEVKPNPGKKAAKAMLTLNPYPGGISFAEPAWRDGELIVASDADMTVSKKKSMKPLLEQEQYVEFAVTVTAKGKIRRLEPPPEAPPEAPPAEAPPTP
jgi:hypothetical protein